MKSVIAASAATLALFIAPVYAADTQHNNAEAAPTAPSAGGSANVNANANANASKVSAADCETLWKKADAGNKGMISEQAASSYISDMKTINADGDTSIEKKEFMAACDHGLIKQSAVQGNTTTGSTNKVQPPSETSDRTPEKSSPTPPEQQDMKDGKTSDRTPKN